MSEHNAAIHLHTDYLVIPDPGNAATITVARNPSVVKIVSAGAETRTLSRPTKSGIQLLVQAKTIGGTVTVTVTGGYNTAGDTTFTLTATGQFYKFESVEYGGAYYWRATSHDGLTNANRTEANLDGILATVAELNRAADVSTRIVTCTASTLAVTVADHDGKIIELDRAAGIAVTLPSLATSSGAIFRFRVKTTFTGAASIKSVAGTDIMVGHALMGNNSDNSVVDWQATAADTFDTIDLLGTSNSTGGIEGQEIEIIGGSANWYVSMRGDAAGTEATPFANTVA